MRIVFFGTADFAVPSLEALLAAGHTILAVVTQPDKPHGRGQKVAASPVKIAALKHELPLLQPKRVRSERFIEKIREMQPDLLALAAFGQIVPQALLDIPPFGPINVHGSLLPKYRGAAPIQRAIMAGEHVTGVTSMWMDASLDTGDVLLSAEVAIEPEDNAGTLFPRLAEAGANVLIETIDGLASGIITRKPQDDALATNAPMLQADDGRILWSETAELCSNRIRGVTPKPGAYLEVAGRRLKVWQAAPDSEPTGEVPGAVISVDAHGVNVAAAESTVLTLLEVQPESGKRMPADAWARGARVRMGDSLTA